MLLFKSNSGPKGYRAEELAEVIGIDRRSVIRKSGIEFYLLQSLCSGKGRPINLYSADALNLWGVSPELIENFKQKKIRKERTDKGNARAMSHDTWLVACKLVKELYINQASDNVQLSCEEATKRLLNAGYTDVNAKQLYARIMRNEPKRGMFGIYYSDPDGNWKAIRNSRLRKNATMLSAATVRYNLYAMMENAGIAGDGFGVGRIIVIDDFTRDAWSLKNGKMHLPGGVAFIDALSRRVLLLLPCETITTNVIATGIMLVVNRYGIHPDTVFVMENSKSMKNLNIEQMVRTLYHPTELERFDNGKITWIKEFFGGQTGPIIRNLPHIPRFLGKALLERFFKIIKDEFDATRFALNYQGGSRKEAVHLTVSAQPIVVGQESSELPVGLYTPDVYEYWQALMVWLDNSCLDRVRSASMFKDFCELKENSIAGSIRNVWNYYSGGGKDTREKPQFDDERLARMLYFAQPERHKFLVTLRNPGHYQTEINGKRINIVHPALSSNLLNRKLATIPVPTQSNRYIVLLINEKTQIPEFLCVAENMTATTGQEASRMRVEVRQTRDAIEETHKNANKTLAVWHTEGTHNFKQNDSWIPNLVSDSNKELTGIISETYEPEEYHEPKQLTSNRRHSKAKTRAEKLLQESEELLKNCSNY